VGRPAHSSSTTSPGERRLSRVRAPNRMGSCCARDRQPALHLLTAVLFTPLLLSLVPSWLADIRAHSDPEVSIILIGNKADLAPAPPATSDDTESSSEAAATPAPAAASSTRVTTAEGEAFAARESLLFLETSAKTGANVQGASLLGGSSDRTMVD
jgi:hypothetical protein